MNSEDAPLVWVIMGVAGSGKTVVGRLLATRLDCDFLEGDRRHSVANIQKMAAQMPLTDTDRQQWLGAIADEIHRAVRRHQETVITCSALKQVHRQQLIAPGRVQLVWLDVPEPDLKRRLGLRHNHYMQAQMLASQLAAFEAVQPEELIFAVDAIHSPQDIVDQIWYQAVHRYPSLDHPWWQR